MNLNNANFHGNDLNSKVNTGRSPVAIAKIITLLPTS